MATTILVTRKFVSRKANPSFEKSGVLLIFLKDGNGDRDDGVGDDNDEDGDGGDGDGDFGAETPRATLFPLFCYSL